MLSADLAQGQGRRAKGPGQALGEWTGPRLRTSIAILPIDVVVVGIGVVVVVVVVVVGILKPRPQG